MEVEFEKLKFTRDWNSSADFPTYEENEQKVRADLQALHDETKEFINETLIPSIENMAVPGTGDMLESIYDPERKRENVYAYADQKVADVTPEGIGAATSEALQSHIDNQNNPHNVTAEQVKVTDNVVNAIKETGAWSVDGILAQLGNTMFGGDVLYQWQKKKVELVYNGIGSCSTTYPKDTALRLISATEYEINADDKIQLVNATSHNVGGGYDYSGVMSQTTYFMWNTAQSNTVWKKTSSSSITKTPVYDTYYTQDRWTVTNAESWTVKASIEVVTSTDPNAYADGYVDEDGYTYTALDPITAFVPRIQTGSYVGTNTYGASNPCSLTFSFAPKVVVLVRYLPTTGIFMELTTKPTMNADCLTTSFQDGTGFLNASARGYGKKSEDGKTISWYNTSAAYQYNASGNTYYWVAIG